MPKPLILKAVIPRVVLLDVVILEVVVLERATLKVVSWLVSGFQSPWSCPPAGVVVVCFNNTIHRWCTVVLW